MGNPGNGDLPFLHHFKQGALHFGRRTVDLVSQQQVSKHRAERRAEISGFLVVNACANQISGYQVGRELYALEVAVYRIGQRFNGKGFGKTRYAFNQQMALGQYSNHDAL